MSCTDHTAPVDYAEDREHFNAESLSDEEEEPFICHTRFCSACRCKSFCVLSTAKHEQ